MAEYHSKQEISNYEEIWQRRYYISSGNSGKYIHVCEICHNTHDLERILGGHTICINCKNHLKLPKEKTIVNWGNAQIDLMKRHKWKLVHPSDPSKKARIEAWKKVIKADYMVELFNKNFNYEDFK